MSETKSQNLKISFGEQSKKLWKFFIFLFLVNFIILNWNDVSWMFNYKFVSRGLMDLFTRDKPYAVKNELPTIEIVKDIKQFNDSNNGNSSLSVTEKNRIEIPKIGIKAPIIFTQANSQEAFQEALKKGVLHFPQSSLPGKEGTSILLGHSAPPNWPKINYDWVFNDLNKLKPGDLIYIYFNQRQYIFSVTKIFFLNKSEEILSQELTNSKSVLMLLSCWPPGRDEKRIITQAELLL